MALEARVKEIISKHLQITIGEVKESSVIIEDLGADSLDCVELTMAFEEEYGLEIPDEDVEKIETVGEAIAYLKDKVA